MTTLGCAGLRSNGSDEGKTKRLSAQTGRRRVASNRNGLALSGERNGSIVRVEPAVWKNAGVGGEECYMSRNNSNRSRAAWARGFVALCAVLAMGLGLMARPAEAAPFGYVANFDDGTVSVIDTATNTVVATVPVGPAIGVAVTPDGNHACAANSSLESVSVIATGTNTVVATVPLGLPVGSAAIGVAVRPDGKHAYVTIEAPINVSVIDTATNKVVATIPVGPGSTLGEGSVAVTPDGKHAYVTNDTDLGTVSVIDTATNTVVAAVGVGNFPNVVAIIPDGKHAYVTNVGSP
jgi:YVTN family beta-propeller protein